MNVFSPTDGLDQARMPRASRARAFSLVEVVLAIGVVSFALVGVMGLIPAGLKTFRQSIDTTVHAQIVQRISGEAQQTDFATLTASTAPVRRYFDEQGQEVAAGEAHIYCVRTTVGTNALLPSGLSTGSLATLVVDIATDVGSDPFTQAVVRPFKTYSTLIAR